MRKLHIRAMAVTVLMASASIVARADAPTGQYAVGAMTTLDQKTGLTWQRFVETTGGDDGSGHRTRANALSYCASLALSGGGWRLPTEKELVTLVDLTRSTPSVDPNAVSVTLDGIDYWSISPVAASPTTKGWSMNFLRGATSQTGMTTPLNVRCVR